MHAVRALLKVSRPVSWINTAAPFVAGYILSVGTFDWRLVVGALFFLIPYNLTMYGINDIFDYESDKDNPRKNSIEGAVAAPSVHRTIWWAVAITTLPLLIVLLLWGGLAAKLWLLFLMFMVVAYSMKGLRFKEVPILDSFTSSTHFYGPLVYGLLLGGSLTGYWPAVIAFVLWGMASHAFGAIQDVEYDRAGGISSIATIFGARTTAWICFILYVVVVAIVAWEYQLQAGRLVAVALVLYPAITYPCLRVTDATAGTTNTAWKQFLWVNQVVGFAITIAYLSSLPGNASLKDAMILTAFVVVLAALAYAGRGGRRVVER